MQNYIQPGSTISAVAPYDVSSGGGCLVGVTFGVAVADAANGTPVQLLTEGIHGLAKQAGQGWTAWTTLIYWDNTEKRCTTSPTGNTLIGVAAATAGSAATSGAVRLQMTLAA